jgi:hypothetical protein
VEREQLCRVFVDALVEPPGDDPRLDFEQTLADSRAVRRDRVPGALANEV